MRRRARTAKLRAHSTSISKVVSSLVVVEAPPGVKVVMVLASGAGVLEGEMVMPVQSYRQHFPFARGSFPLGGQSGTKSGSHLLFLHESQ